MPTIPIATSRLCQGLLAGVDPWNCSNDMGHGWGENVVRYYVSKEKVATKKFVSRPTSQQANEPMSQLKGPMSVMSDTSFLYVSCLAFSLKTTGFLRQSFLMMELEQCLIVFATVPLDIQFHQSIRVVS